MSLKSLIHELCRLDDVASKLVWAEVRKRHPGKGAVPASALIGIPTPPQRDELRALVYRQSAATIYLLCTIWRVGRGDFPADRHLLEEYIEIADSFPNVRAAANWLLGKNKNPFFEDALALLEDAGIEVDSLLQ